jgi:hypothetical protein
MVALCWLPGEVTSTRSGGAAVKGSPSDCEQVQQAFTGFECGRGIGLAYRGWG